MAGPGCRQRTVLVIDLESGEPIENRRSSWKERQGRSGCTSEAGDTGRGRGVSFRLAAGRRAVRLCILTASYPTRMNCKTRIGA